MFSSLRGIKGNPGRQGEDGEQGIQGIQGVQGAKGDTGEAGTGGYVNRGDPSGADWTEGTLTEDGAFHDLDLSSIIPEGTLLVHLRVLARDNAGGKSVQFKKKGQTNNVNNGGNYTQAASKTITHDVFVQPDASRLIEYYISAGTWEEIGIAVAGWFV